MSLSNPVVPPHMRHNGQKQAIHQLSPEVSDRLGATHLQLEPPPAPSFFKRDQMSLEDSHPYRVALGWRIVRTIARLKGLVTDEELLVEGLPFDPSPWLIGQTGFGALPADQRDNIYRELRIEPAVRQIFTIAIDMPLLPPQILSPFDIEAYDPSTDERLLTYIDMVARLAAHYGYDSHDDGACGLQGLLSPDTIRLAFPSSGEIMSYENRLALYIAEHLGHLSTRDLRRQLAQKHHLTETEINMAVKIGIGQLHRQQSQDVEDARAIIVARTEDFITRSREGLDLTNEAKGLKILTVVQGLTRTEPEDANKDFEQMVDRVATEKPTVTQHEVTVIDVPSHPSPPPSP